MTAPLKPSEIVRQLDEHVIGQDAAKRKTAQSDTRWHGNTFVRRQQQS